ncbi:MAG: hypothetical protein RJA70_4139 [Pseudomonadota bacterium]|jgi:predicted alpha/beta-hydrolase family hydrolase
MERYASALASIGTVRRFDYAYMRAQKRAPDRLPTLLATHRGELAALLADTAHQSGPVVLIGKSMGGRVGCHLSLDAPVAAVICLGYPLRGVGKAQSLRDGALVALTVPALFVQGTRDSLCPLDQLTAVRERMTAPNSLHVVPSGDHSLLATKTYLRESGTTQAQLEAEILEKIRDFCGHL